MALNKVTIFPSYSNNYHAPRDKLYSEKPHTPMTVQEAHGNTRITQAFQHHRWTQVNVPHYLCHKSTYFLMLTIACHLHGQILPIGSPFIPRNALFGVTG